MTTKYVPTVSGKHNTIQCKAHVQLKDRSGLGRQETMVGDGGPA